MLDKDINMVFQGVEKTLMSTTQLVKKMEQYNSILKNLRPDSKQFRTLAKELNSVENELSDIILKSPKMTEAIEDMGRKGMISANKVEGLTKELKNLQKVDLNKNFRSFNVGGLSKDFQQLKQDTKEVGAEFLKTFIEGGNEGLNMAERVGDAWNDAADTVFQFGGVYGYAIGLAMKALTPFVKKMFELSDAQKDVREVTKQATESIAKETIESNKLFNTLKDVNTTQEERSKTISEINSKYGKYLPNLLTEKSSAEDIAKAYNSVTMALKELAIQRSQQAVTESIFEQQAKKELNLQLALSREQEGLNKLRAQGISDEDERVRRRLATISEYRKQLIDINSTTVKRINSLDNETDKLREALGLKTKQQKLDTETFLIGQKRYRLTVQNLNEQKLALREQFMAARNGAVDLANGIGEAFGATEKFIGDVDAEFEAYFNNLLSKVPKAVKNGNDYNKVLADRLNLLKQINDAQKQAVFERGQTDREREQPFDPTDLQAYLETLYIRLDRLMKLREKGGQMTELERQLKAEADAIQEKIDKENEYYKTQKENQEKLERQRQQAEAKRQQGSVNVRSQREQLQDIQNQGVNVSGIAQALRSQLEAEGLEQTDIDAIIPQIVSELQGSGLAKVMGDGKLRGLRLTDVSDLAEALMNQYVEMGDISVSGLYKAGYQSEASLKEYENTLDRAVTSTEYALKKNKENLEKSKDNSEVLKAQAEQVEADKKAAEEARMAQSDVGKDILFIQSEIAKTQEQLRQGASKGNQILDNLITDLDLTAEQRKLADEQSESFEKYMAKLAGDNNIAVKEAYDKIVNDPEVKKNIQGLAKVLGFDANTLEDIFDITDPDEEGFERLFVTPLSDEQLADLDKEANKTYKETYMKLFEAANKSQSFIDQEFDEERKNAQRNFREVVLSTLFGSKDLSEVVENLKSEIALRRAEMASAMPELEKEADKLKDIISTSKDPQEIEEAKTRLENIRGSVLQSYQYIVDLEQRLLKVQGADILTEAVKRGVEDLTSELQDAKTETINVTTKQEQERADIEVKFSVKDDKKSGDSNDDDPKKAKDLQKNISTITNISSNVFNSIGSLRDYFIDALNDSINNLSDNLNKIEAEADRINSKIDELENDLEGKRSGRREAILQALEAERLKEEELAKTKMGLQEQLAKQEAKLAKQEKERAKEQLLYDLAMAISNIAVGVTKALASKGALGIIEGVAIGGAGAVQTGIISAQIASFAEGGFTGNGEGQRDETGFKQAGVVHEGEWVAPKWMVENPTYGNIINSLENTRQKGFADGGFTSPNFEKLNDSIVTDNTMLRQIENMIMSNNKLANRPIYVDVTDINNLNNQNYRRVNSTRIGGRK